MENYKTDFDNLWNYSKPADTREKFKAHLGNSKDLDYELQLQTQIARTHSLSGEFKEAHEILDKVEAQLNQKTMIAKVRFLLERGRTFNSSGEKEKAEELFKSAFKLSDEIGTIKYTIDAVHMVAIAAGTIEEKVDWVERGVEIARSSDSEKLKSWEGIFYNNIGWDLFDEKRYEDALEKFKKCADFHKVHGNKESHDIALWSMAKAYRFLGKVDEALEIQEGLLKASNGVDESGYIFEELSELYSVKGDDAKAQEYRAKIKK